MNHSFDGLVWTQLNWSVTHSFAVPADECLTQLQIRGTEAVDLLTRSIQWVIDSFEAGFQKGGSSRARYFFGAGQTVVFVVEFSVT